VQDMKHDDSEERILVERSTVSFHRWPFSESEDTGKTGDPGDMGDDAKLAFAATASTPQGKDFSPPQSPPKLSDTGQSKSVSTCGRLTRQITCKHRHQHPITVVVVIISVVITVVVLVTTTSLIIRLLISMQRQAEHSGQGSCPRQVNWLELDDEAAEKATLRGSWREGKTAKISRRKSARQVAEELVSR
jgi:hypothetical protein